MKAKTFKVKKIDVVRDKRNFLIEFELENGEWSNFFELTMKKDDNMENIKIRVIDKVKDMVAIKDRENELRVKIVGMNFSLNDTKQGK